MLCDHRAVVAPGVQHGHQALRRAGVGLAEPPERAPVGPEQLAAGIDRQQHLIEVGDGLADRFALTAKPLGQR